MAKDALHAAEFIMIAGFMSVVDGCQAGDTAQRQSPFSACVTSEIHSQQGKQRDGYQ